MKQLIVSLFLIILFSPISLAETKIFSGKVITDYEKVIDGKIFKFKYDENSNKVFADTPTTSLIVDNGACKSNNVFRVCINSANFSHKNITTYVYYYEIDTTIYKLTGSLTTVAKSMLSTLLQGESTDLVVSITNPTDFDITNIALTYDLTPFSLIDVKGCDLSDKQISWKGSLKSKYDKTCTAIIIANEEGKYTLIGNLSYFNGFEIEKKATDALSITVLPKQLKVSQLIDTDMGLKKPFYFNISLQNIHSSEDINVRSTITLPSHVSLIKDTPILEKDARVLKHGLILKPGAGINYSLYMEKLSEGTEPINSGFVYTIKGITDIIKNSTFIDIISTQPTNKSAEIKIEKEKSNESLNLTTTKDLQISQAISENKTSDAKLESGNKTAEQVALDLQESKPSNRNILLLIIIVFAVILPTLLIMFKIRKGKKGEVIEKLNVKNNEDGMKPKNF